MAEISIRILEDSRDLYAAVELQRVYWGEDMSDLVPFHMLKSICNHGGHVHAAFDGQELVGMLLGFLGADIHSDTNDDAPSRMLIMSKRMVVKPQYRGRKIGEMLKLAQAHYARDHNIQLVSWTFDPILSRNAYLNIHKLRAIGQRYIEDYFGPQQENPVLSADRLVANWWVNHAHVKDPVRVNIDNAPVANGVSLSSDSLLVPLEFRLPEHDVIRLEIPSEFQPIERIDPPLAKRWREHVRVAFQRIFAAGFIATDFHRVENRVFYVFTRDDGTYDFQDR